MNIAVFLSTYNGEQYLKKQLDSLVNQTLSSSVKIYVRDDGSSDRTISILNSYKDKIAITVKKGSNKGPAKSFWELFNDTRIKADYYAFCDQDDIWDADKIERGVKALSGKEKPLLWCSNCRVMDGGDNLVSDLYHEKEPIFTLPSQFVCGAIQGCAMMFNDSFREYILSRNVSVFPMHDFVFVTYAILTDALIYEHEPSFNYRIHSGNVVAKEKKYSLAGIKKTLNNWFSKKSRNGVSEYARFFYVQNKDCLSPRDSEFFEQLTGSRRSLAKRFKLIRNPACKAYNKRALRSFKIRALLGIL